MNAHVSYQVEPVVRTKLDFHLDQAPRFWFGGDPFRTRMFDALSLTFPDGERYFIECVRLFRDKIDDPDLQERVADFIRQEAQHGMAHDKMNQIMKDQGMPVDQFTARLKKIFRFELKNRSPQYNIAMTAALEHFTAMMADLFFAEKDMLEGADSRVRAMFAWHAIEEMEHKAVAFDVMQKVANVGYGLRVTAMTHATLAFSFYTVIAPWYMLKMDGYSTRERLTMYAKGLPWLVGPRKGVLGRLLPMIGSYYKPGFHPNHIPTVHNYRAWLDAFVSTGDPMLAADAMHRAAA